MPNFVVTLALVANVTRVWTRRSWSVYALNRPRILDYLDYLKPSRGRNNRYIDRSCDRVEIVTLSDDYSLLFALRTI